MWNDTRLVDIVVPGQRLKIGNTVGDALEGIHGDGGKMTRDGLGFYDPGTGSDQSKDPRKAIEKPVLFEKVWYALMSMSSVDPFELFGVHLDFPIPMIGT